VPPLPVGLQPIPLDRAAVAAAVEACARTAALLGGLEAARASAAAVAREHWLGPARERFDEGAARLDLEAADLLADLARTAAGIAAAAEAVALENRRRAAAAEEWSRRHLVAPAPR
jgi:hypothetical protein